MEFIGLAGLGQAEVAAIKRSDVELDAGHINVYRHKTARFRHPDLSAVAPAGRETVQRQEAQRALFSISQARKAITNACRRLRASDLHTPITSPDVHHALQSKRA